MSDRHFNNPFISGTPLSPSIVNRVEVIDLIKDYVNQILTNAPAGSTEDRGDLYVGDAGIAFMFLQMQACPELNKLYSCLDHARVYIDSAKRFAKQYSKRADERCAFLLGYNLLIVIVYSSLLMYNSLFQECWNICYCCGHFWEKRRAIIHVIRTGTILFRFWSMQTAAL